MSGSSQSIFIQLTKLPSATADSDAQVGLGIPSSFTKPSLSGHFLYTGRCRSLLLERVNNKIKILIVTILISCDNVGQKHFESLHGWFELDYPGHWTQFDEDDGTYLFMDNEDWKGNLRITAMKVENDQDPNRIERNLVEERERKIGSTTIKLGDLDAVYWTKEVEEDGDTLTIYNWTTGDKGVLLVCSFAVDKERADEKVVKEELNYALETLKSIKVR